MIPRIIAAVAVIASLAAFFGLRYLDGMRQSHEVVVQTTLDGLVSYAHDTLTSAISSELSRSQALSVPAPFALPLCGPNVNPCYSSGQIAYSIAGSTTAGDVGGSVETAYSVTGALSEARVVVNATVKIVDTDPACGTGCVIGQRTAQLGYRTYHAPPYFTDLGVLPTSAASQASAIKTSADYAGCDSTRGCGTLPTGGATPEPRTLVSNPNCTSDPYGGCVTTTPPPANTSDKTFTNTNLGSHP